MTTGVIKCFSNPCYNTPTLKFAISKTSQLGTQNSVPLEQQQETLRSRTSVKISFVQDSFPRIVFLVAYSFLRLNQLSATLDNSFVYVCVRNTLVRKSG